MLPRHVSGAVVSALSDRPAVFLHGARQAGKTTLARQIADTAHPARYLTFDDSGVLAAARSDPAGFLAGLEGPVVLDEVQRAPEAFAEATGKRFHRGVVLYTGSEVVPFGARLHALPVSALWRWKAKPQKP